MPDVNNYLFYLIIIVKGKQTVNLRNLRDDRRTGQVTDGNGNSGLRFTTRNNLTRGITTRNFTDVRVGPKTIVPGICRMYEENYKVSKTRSKW